MDMVPSKLMTTASLANLPDLTVGSAKVSPSTRTIAGPGGVAQVEPRVMQVLIVLANAEGGVVTRDELFDRCWGGVYVGDDSLNRAIAGVRKLGAGVGGGSFEIETVPRTGYRLAGTVQWSEDLPPEEATRASGAFSRRLLIGGALAAVAGLGGIGLWTSNRTTSDPAAPLIRQGTIAMRPGTSEGQTRGLALLTEATTRYPGSAAAWGALALARARIDEHAIIRLTQPAALVTEAAERALQLDRDNADAKAALAIIIPYFGDWLAAERRFDAVLADHPDHVLTHDSRSFLLGAVGRMRESARDRLSHSPVEILDADLNFRTVYCHWFLGQIAEADRAAARGLAMWPRHAGNWYARLWIFAETGRYDRALDHLSDDAQRPALPPPTVSALRDSLRAAISRDPADVSAATRQIMAGVSRSVAAVINAMLLLNLLRATDEAFGLAQAYYFEKGPVRAAMTAPPGELLIPDQRRRKTNMMFTPLSVPMQRDPRFLPLMREIGLEAYWRQRGVTPDFLSRT